MCDAILVNLAVEDDLSEHMLRVVLQQSRKNYLVGGVYGKRGNGFLRRSLAAFNNASRGSTHIVLTDLDQAVCPPKLIEEWFQCPIAEYRQHCHRNLLFNVAVREVEAWIFADRSAFAHFLGINRNLIPPDVETVADPKAELLKLVGHSRYRKIKEDILPRPGDIRKTGPNYNGRLGEFIRDSWRITRAREHSASLSRLHETLNIFQPIFHRN